MNSSGDGPGVVGESNGIGVEGTARLTSVFGPAYENGYEGVYGEHTGTSGYGVVGDGSGPWAGVLGRNNAGEGGRGVGRTGVYARSTSSASYGAVCEGGKAQLRLVPRTTAGKPTSGSHAKGELLLDSAATLWICIAGGTPGTWRKVSTTAT